MFIQCTEALRKKLGLKEEDLSLGEKYQQYPNSLRAWHGNLIRYNGKQSVVLMNDETRYTVLLYAMKAKDFTRMDELVMEGIRVALEMEGVRPEVIKEYLQVSQGVFYGKTRNRSMVAKLNSSTSNLQAAPQVLEEDRIIQRSISRVVSRYPAGHGGYPYKLLLTNLHAFDPYKKKSIIETPLYQLKIQLELAGHDIYRRVAVPALFTFRQLHKIISVSFDWQERHLHLFEINNTFGKPIQILMDDDPGTLEYYNEETHQIKIENTTFLQEIFPRYKQVQYTYDYGDNWVHKIELEKITMSNQLAAEYLGGKGERPPEDVGGESGFDEYLRVMQDEKDPDYETMKIWSENQKQRPMDSERLNQRIQWIF